jgi:hypothetical protein
VFALANTYRLAQFLALAKKREANKVLIIKKKVK